MHSFFNLFRTIDTSVSGAYIEYLAKAPELNACFDVVRKVVDNDELRADAHVTVIVSTTPSKSNKELYVRAIWDAPDTLEAKVIGFDQLDGADDTVCALVLLLDEPKLHKLHADVQRSGLRPIIDRAYKPHLSLGYNVPKSEVPDLIKKLTPLLPAIISLHTLQVKAPKKQ